jgi:DNA-binding NarL/FixJ family response regulator
MENNGTAEVRLIIVDDDPEMRSILRSLAEDMGAEVVAEAENGRAAIESAHTYPAEVMLLDISMPKMGGIPAAKQLRQDRPDLHIIFVTHYAGKAYVQEALELGASGYLVKGSVATELGPAIHDVMEGRTFISSRVEPRLAL